MCIKKRDLNNIIIFQNYLKFEFEAEIIFTFKVSRKKSYSELLSTFPILSPPLPKK